MAKERDVPVPYAQIGLGQMLTIAFVVMKLAGVGVVARWSWWWVLAPVWIPLAIIAAGLLVLVSLALLSMVLN